MSAPYLTTSKSSIYYYRRAVPKNLRPIIGKREIKVSLGRDFTSAMKRYPEVHSQAEKALEAARLSTAPNSARDQVLAILAQHGLTPEDIERRRHFDPDDPADLDWDVGFDSIVIDPLIDDYEEAERHGREARISIEAIRALSAGVIPPKVHTIATALEFYRESLEGPDTAKNKALENRLHLLKKCIAEALGEKAVVERPVEHLTREHARRIRDHLLKGGREPTTVRRMLNPLKAAITKTILEFDLNIRNPFEKLEIKGASHSREDRLPLTDEDMMAVQPVVITAPDDPLSILWIVLRDTGARTSEICRRKVGDVDRVQQSINSPIGKTKNAIREVPLSPAAFEGIERLSRGKRPDDLLFPHYATGRKTDYASAALMRRFRKVIRHPKKCVNSLRHRMTDRLRNTGCPEDIRKEIMGHDTQNVARNYGKGYALAVKRSYLERVW